MTYCKCHHLQIINEEFLKGIIKITCSLFSTGLNKLFQMMCSSKYKIKTEYIYAELVITRYCNLLTFSGNTVM